MGFGEVCVLRGDDYYTVPKLLVALVMTQPFGDDLALTNNPIEVSRMSTGWLSATAGESLELAREISGGRD